MSRRMRAYSWMYRIEERAYDALEGRVPERWSDRIEWPAWAHEAVCRVLGHDPQVDHCLMPEHDCCAACGKSMPHQAPRRIAS